MSFGPPSGLAGSKPPRPHTALLRDPKDVAQLRSGHRPPSALSGSAEKRKLPRNRPVTATGVPALQNLTIAAKTQLLPENNRNDEVIRFRTPRGTPRSDHIDLRIPSQGYKSSVSSFTKEENFRSAEIIDLVAESVNGEILEKSTQEMKRSRSQQLWRSASKHLLRSFNDFVTPRSRKKEFDTTLTEIDFLVEIRGDVSEIDFAVSDDRALHVHAARRLEEKRTKHEHDIARKKAGSEKQNAAKLGHSEGDDMDPTLFGTGMDELPPRVGQGAIERLVADKLHKYRTDETELHALQERVAQYEAEKLASKRKFTRGDPVMLNRSRRLKESQPNVRRGLVEQRAQQLASRMKKVQERKKELDAQSSQNRLQLAMRVEQRELDKAERKRVALYHATMSYQWHVLSTITALCSRTEVLMSGLAENRANRERMRLETLASIRAQRCIRAWLNRVRFRRRLRAYRVLKPNFWFLMFNFRIHKKVQAADIIQQSLTEALRSQQMVRHIHKFKLRVCRCQRLVRSFNEGTRNRLRLMSMQWKQKEGKIIKQILDEKISKMQEESAIRDLENAVAEKKKDKRKFSMAHTASVSDLQEGIAQLQASIVAPTESARHAMLCSVIKQRRAEYWKKMASYTDDLADAKAKLAKVEEMNAAIALVSKNKDELHALPILPAHPFISNRLDADVLDWLIRRAVGVKGT
jgi:hypothetical protein